MDNSTNIINNNPEIDHWRMIFKDSEIEKYFWTWNFPERLKLLNRNLIIAAITNFSFIFTDIYQKGLYFSFHLILMKTSLSLMIVVSLWLINIKKESDATDIIIKITSSFYVIGVSIVFYFMRRSNLTDGSILMLVILSYYFFIPQTFLLTSIIAIVNTFLFVAIIYKFYHIPEIQFYYILLSLISLNLYCIAYLRSIHLQKRKEFFDYNNLIQYKIALEKEILDKQILEKELRDLAETDSLTGILNRRAFFDTAEKEMNRSLRYGQALSLILFDLDHFKDINDRFGHATGDQVLRAVTEKVQSSLRKTDIFARIGGEEFVILLPGIDREQAEVVAEKTRNVFNEKGNVIPGGFTASFGVVQAKEETKDITELLSLADKAMYKAKQLGRNRVEVL